MSAIATYQQFSDTIELYKGRIEDLQDQNKRLKKLMEMDSSQLSELHSTAIDLEYKLGQYQEAAYKLCKAIYYEQTDENQLAHSTRDSVSSFMAMWNSEDKKIFNEKLQHESN